MAEPGGVIVLGDGETFDITSNCELHMLGRRYSLWILLRRANTTDYTDALLGTCADCDHLDNEGR